MKVVVIIPTYNEKENIGLMLEEMVKISARQKNDKYITLVVDSNSPDGTGEIVKTFVQKYRNIILLSDMRKGLGKSIIFAYRYALKKLSPDIVVTTEADFAYKPSYIPFAVEKVKKGYDVVVASRHVPTGKAEGWTLNRKVNHWIANKFFATWVAGVREVRDHNGAFRAIRVKGVLDKINFKKVRATGFGFFNYFLFKLTQATNKFYEFPVTYKFRTKGESKVSFNPKYFAIYIRDVLEYIKLSFQIRLERGKMKLT